MSELGEEGFLDYVLAFFTGITRLSVVDIIDENFYQSARSK